TRLLDGDRVRGPRGRHRRPPTGRREPGGRPSRNDRRPGRHVRLPDLDRPGRGTGARPVRHETLAVRGERRDGGAVLRGDRPTARVSGPLARPQRTAGQGGSLVAAVTATAVVDCEGRSTREVNLTIKGRIAEGADRIEIEHSAARHSLAVAIKADATLEFRGPVGWYAAGMNDRRP